MNAWLCTRNVAVRVPCSCVSFVSVPIRCRLRVTRYACAMAGVDLGSHNILFITDMFRFWCVNLLINSFVATVLTKPVSAFILTETISCFTVAHLIIRWLRCLASGGWAGLSTTRSSFCSWPTLQRAARPCWHLLWHSSRFSRRLHQSGPTLFH